MNNSKYNYHVKTLENGEKLYFVKANGKWVNVNKDIHHLLTSTDRRQRQIDMVQAQHGYISIDAIRKAITNNEGCGYLPEELQVRSAEDIYIEIEDRSNRRKKLTEVIQALKQYPKADQFIIEGYYFKGLKVAVIAKHLNLSEKTIYKRKAAILKKLCQECNGGEM